MLVGVGFTAQGNFVGSHYRIHPAARSNPKVSWIFDGVSADTVGGEGFSGHGAAGFELDRLDHRLGSPLNAVVLACNQKTSREPVMNLTQGQVGQSLRALESQGLARLQMGSRADRWEHRVDKALELVPAQQVLLGLMFLRGPQTVNELLTNAIKHSVPGEIRCVLHCDEARLTIQILSPGQLQPGFSIIHHIHRKGLLFQSLL